MHSFKRFLLIGILAFLSIAARVLVPGNGEQLKFAAGDRTIYEIRQCDLPEATAQVMSTYMGLPNVTLQAGVQFTVEIRDYRETPSHPDLFIDGVYIFEDGISNELALNLNLFLGPAFAQIGLGRPYAVRTSFDADITNGNIIFANRTEGDHTIHKGYYLATGWLAYYWDNSSEWTWEVMALKTIPGSSDEGSLGFGFEIVFLVLAFPVIYQLKRRTLGKNNRKKQL
jgi:hypothetical protein